MKTIDLSGPDGNAFALMGIATGWAKQIGLDAKAICEKMRQGDYNMLLDAFDDTFSRRVRYEFLSDPREEEEDDA